MCVRQKIGGIIRGFIFSFFVDVSKHLILPQRSYNGQDSTCVSHCHTSDWVCFSDQKSYRRLVSLNTGRRNNFPTSGHFIALINQTNPPYWRLARKKLEEKKICIPSWLHVLESPLPGFSADLLGESVILHKLVLLPLIQSIRNGQKPWPGVEGRKGSTRCHPGFKVDCEMKKAITVEFRIYWPVQNVMEWSLGVFPFGSPFFGENLLDFKANVSSFLMTLQAGSNSPLWQQMNSNYSNVFSYTKNGKILQNLKDICSDWLQTGFDSNARSCFSQKP